jgi:putative transposase
LIALHLSHLGFLKPIARGDTPLLRVGRAILKSEGGGRVFTTSLVNVPEVELLPNTKKAVALDVGVEKLLVTSDTEYFPNAGPYEKALLQLRKMHRDLSRKTSL